MTRYLAFAVADGLYALERSWLRATLHTHPGVRGEVPLHGRSYPVVDPRAVFERPRSAGSCEALLLVAPDGPLALLVDRLVGEVEVADDRWQELPWCFAGRERLWFSGVVALDDGSPLVRLRPGGVLASFRALRAAHSEDEEWSSW